MILSGPVFVQDLKEDLTQARAIISRSYSDRFRIRKNTSTGPHHSIPTALNRLSDQTTYTVGHHLHR